MTETLQARIEALEAAIRKHRAATGHEMCHENDEELWSILGDGVTIDHTPPPWCDFMQKCAEYRASKDKDPNPVLWVRDHQKIWHHSSDPKGYRAVCNAYLPRDPHISCAQDNWTPPDVCPICTQLRGGRT